MYNVHTLSDEHFQKYFESKPKISHIYLQILKYVRHRNYHRFVIKHRRRPTGILIIWKNAAMKWTAKGPLRSGYESRIFGVEQKSRNSSSLYGGMNNAAATASSRRPLSAQLYVTWKKGTTIVSQGVPKNAIAAFVFDTPCCRVKFGPGYISADSGPEKPENPNFWYQTR